MQALNITIFGITVWHKIFVGSNFCEFRGFFVDLQKLNPMKTNSRPKKSRKNLLLLFTLLNFNEIGCKQCNQNDHMASVFVTFKYCTWNLWKLFLGPRNNFQGFRKFGFQTLLLVRVKSEIQICENLLLRKTQKLRNLQN